jgi:hypothetical protein
LNDNRGFKVSIVRKICQAYGLKNRYHRLRKQGLLTQVEENAYTKNRQKKTIRER